MVFNQEEIIYHNIHLLIMIPRLIDIISTRVRKFFFRDVSAFLLSVYAIIGELFLFYVYIYYFAFVAPKVGEANAFVNVTNQVFTYINIKVALFIGGIIFFCTYFVYSNFKKGNFKKLEYLLGDKIGSRSAIIAAVVFIIVFAPNFFIGLILDKNIYLNLLIYIGILSLILCFSVEADYYFYSKSKLPLSTYSLKELELEHNTLLESIKIFIQTGILLFTGFFAVYTYYWIKSVPESQLNDPIVMNALTNDFIKIFYLLVGAWLGIINPYFKYMADLRKSISRIEKSPKNQ